MISSYLKATTAVNSGSMPDLMLVTGLSCERVADKGYFVDLYEFLEDGDRSSVVDKADLFQGRSRRWNTTADCTGFLRSLALCRFAVFRRYLETSRG